MPDRKDGLRGVQPKITPQMILLALVFGILLLSIFAFRRPILQDTPQATSSPTSVDALEAEDLPTQATMTVTPDLTEAPPTPEEIGFTDEIIFWSTVLIVILLVGVLRETVHWKKR